MAAHGQQDPIHSLSPTLGLPPCPCQYLWLQSAPSASSALKPLAFKTGHVFSLAHTYLCVPISLLHPTQMPLFLHPPPASIALLHRIPPPCSVLQGEQPSGSTAPIGRGVGGLGILFPFLGCPDLVTSGPFLGSHAAADRPTHRLAQGLKGLTLASHSLGFSFSLPRSSAGGPWANDRTSGILSFLISTRGAQTVQQPRDQRALLPPPLPGHPGGRCESAGPEGELQRQPARPRPGGQ